MCAGFSSGHFVHLCLFTYVVCPFPHIADFSEDFGFGRDAPPAVNQGEWQQRGYIGRPSQRKTSNCDASVKNRPQQGRETEGAQSSFCDTEKSGPAPLKG